MNDETKKPTDSIFRHAQRYEDNGRVEEETPQEEVGSGESYGQYLFGSSFVDPNDPDSAKANWSSYTTGRVMIRLFSRGLLGAGLYTWAHHQVPKQLGHKDILGHYDPNVALSELGGITKYPLRYIARGFDTIYGTPIKAATKMTARAMGKSEEVATQWAHDATWFRGKVNYTGGQAYKNGMMTGRSLGHEITGMTFDFAAGSVGDAMGRQIATIADPNIPNCWEEETKDGRKVRHFWHDRNGWHPKDMAISAGKSAWQIFSKNQGEDWAVGLPYVYQMAWQREMLGKVYPGFRVSSDHQLNGSSFMARANRTVHNKSAPDRFDVIGSYAKAGAIDLQLRFTGYNWYTLMYRDAYDSIAKTIKEVRHNDGKLPDMYIPSHPLHASVDLLGHTFRYGIRSAIKAVLYMTPAVPTFWATRTPQNKGRGFPIVPSQLNTGMRIGVDQHAWPTIQYGKPVDISPIGPSHQRFNKMYTSGGFDRLLSPFGDFSHRASIATLGVSNSMGLGLSKEMAHTFANASISYTPYMITKAETALRWDKPLMDKAINHFLDGVFSLNIAEARAGLIDMREQIIHPPSNRKIEEVMKLENERRDRRIAELKKEQEELEAQKREYEGDDVERPETDVDSVKHEKTVLAAQAEEGVVKDSWAHKALNETFNKDDSVPKGTSIH